MFKKKTVVDEIDDDTEYYMAVAINGKPILANTLLFAKSGNQILLSYGDQDVVEFAQPSVVKDKLSVKIVEPEQLDKISQKNLSKILEIYEKNQDVDNSYQMWSKMVKRTFGIEYFVKNFNLFKKK